MNTVIARFHHLNRDLDQLEAALVEAGADDAQITGYTIALSFRTGSRESSVEAAHRLLSQVGATHIKIRRRRLGAAEEGSHPDPASNASDLELAGRQDGDSAAAMANVMAKIEMDVFGHP